MKNLRISWGFSFELRISLTLSFRCVHHSIAKRMSLIRRLIMCPSARDVPAPPRRGTLGGGPEPPAGQHGAHGGTKTRRKYETGGTRLSRPMGRRTPPGCGCDKRVPPAVSFTAYHGWTLPCFFSRTCPSPVAFSSALSGRVSSSRAFRAGSSPCRAALS